MRGVPVDDVAATETPELREIRRFEEQAFPKPGGPETATPGAATKARRPPSALPGEWGGSGDVPAEVRSPQSAARVDGTAPPPDSEWLRSLKLPDLPVRWDAQVLRYLDYFKNDPKGHAVMAGWLRRAGRYRELFEKTLERQGLPKDLFYVAMVESGFDTGARSRVGAGGIWQFMPGAARAYGLEVSYWVDARRDPERAVDAAARYLKDLYVRFGSWYLVFAAYNAGYGSVLRSITTYNTNDFWELCRHESGLPWESTLYVPKILAAAIVGHNLAAFGFADVDARRAVRLRAGRGAGRDGAGDGRARGGDQGRGDRGAEPGPVPRRARRPIAARPRCGCRPAPPRSTPRASTRRATADKLETVVLRFGETLDDVARAHGSSARELRRLNGVKETAELRGGTSIVVPAPRRRSRRPRPRTSDKDGDVDGRPADGEAGTDDDTILVAVPDRSFSYDGRERVFYRTRDGDGLDEVADVFGVRSEDLVEWNNLDPGAKLHPRMVLQIFVRKDFDPAGVLLLDPTKVRVVTLGSEEFLQLETARRGKKRLFYSAKAGDTLAKLGRRYGLTPGDLARINRFSYNTELHEGDRIVVYSPTGDAPREVTRGMTPGEKRPGARDGDGERRRRRPGRTRRSPRPATRRRRRCTIPRRRSPSRPSSRPPAKPAHAKPRAARDGHPAKKK